MDDTAKHITGEEMIAKAAALAARTEAGHIAQS